MARTPLAVLARPFGRKRLTFRAVPLLAFSLMACSFAGQAMAADADPGLVAQGRYLAAAGDCAACHENPATGNPYARGYAVESPLGKIFGSNITPSVTDGIGRWSLSDFADAVRKGRAPGMHFLYPAMPYTAFAGISDADIKALYSYFMLGVKPVDQPAPKTSLAFPFNIRPVMLGWNLLFSRAQPASDAEAAPGSAARGRYLVDTFAHCSTCHTPRNALMAEESSRFLGGGMVGSWVAPNITSDPVSGIGDWTEQQLVQYLKTGALHGKAIAAGEMGTAVEKSFSKLNDADLQAIAAYIKSVPAVRSGATTPRSGWSTSSPAPVSALEHPVAAQDYAQMIKTTGTSGAALYESACATCHAYDGRGTPDGRLPSLVGSSAVGSSDPANLVMTITDGVSRTVDGHHVFMPAFGPQHTEFGTQFGPEEIAQIADYVATSFGDPAHHVSTADVRRIYASATQKGWLIAHAAALTWWSLGVGIAVVAALAAGLFWRRQRRAA